MKTAMMLVLALVLAGCDSNASNALGSAPTGAYNAKDLGNHWVLFDLNIDGKPHRFLYRRINDHTSHATEVITEVSR